MQGTLYLVATPIGNLQDISFRAVEVLRSVDLIACEDTRHTRKLLNSFDISAKLISYHDHNEEERSSELVERMLDGSSIALVSDAGTPGINDPGYRLVGKCIESGIRVVPIPGPAAFVSAVVASGLPTDSLLFGGFLPSKTGERKKRLRRLADIPATLVFYEAPHRIAAAVRDAIEVLGDREAVLAREITKLHEEFIRGRLSALASRLADEAPRGEFVLIIARGDGAGTATDVGSLSDRVRQLLSEGLDKKAALKQAAKERGIGKSEAYRLLQSEKA